MRDYFANYDIVTPAIVEAVANHEAEVLTTHKSKSILRQSEEPGTNDTADKLIAWAGDVAIEQLASLSKDGTRSCRETYKRLNVCCKNSNEVKALESYPKRRKRSNTMCSTKELYADFSQLFPISLTSGFAATLYMKPYKRQRKRVNKTRTPERSLKSLKRLRCT